MGEHLVGFIAQSFVTTLGVKENVVSRTQAQNHILMCEKNIAVDAKLLSIIIVFLFWCLFCLCQNRKRCNSPVGLEVVFLGGCQTNMKLVTIEHSTCFFVRIKIICHERERKTEYFGLFGKVCFACPEMLERTQWKKAHEAANA